MAIVPRLDLRPTQSLAMTPQLRQAIKLLQCSNLEASALVAEELERNPLLERAEDADPDIALGGVDAPPEELPDAPPSGSGEGEADLTRLLESDAPPGGETLALDVSEADLYDEVSEGGDSARWSEAGSGRGAAEGDEGESAEARLASRPSLREQLAQQLRLAFADSPRRLIGAHLIAALDEAGRLATPVAEIARQLGVAEAEVEEVRQRMMRFEPVGLFATSLRECLAVQLAERNRLDPAMEALLDHLELLARRDIARLLEICGVSREDLTDMIAELRTLDPKPGAGFEDGPASPVIPDLLVTPRREGGFRVELNPETLPRVVVNRGLYRHAQARSGREGRAFLAEHFQNASWLVRALEQRASTILRVAEAIVAAQEGFLRHGISHLRPLTLKDIAGPLELHESTVSRVTTNKFMATPRGTFELKFFFTTALGGGNGETHSAEAVRHRIRALIEAEPPDRVLSDDELAALLRREGITIARRTVAKYRESWGIPGSLQRKREKATLRV